MAEIGGALGVDMLLVSDLGLVGTTYVFNLKLVDNNKVKVIKRVYKTVTGQPDDLIEEVRGSLPTVMAAATGEGAPKAERALPRGVPGHAVPRRHHLVVQ